MNSGGILSGPWAFPPFSSFMVAVSSEVVKSLTTSPRHPPHHSTLPLNVEVCCLSAPLKRPLANSCFEMKLVVIGHCFESDLHSVRRLKVFQAFLLEWVKSIPSIVSSHRLLQFLLRWFIRSAVLASADCLSSAWTNSL